MGTNDTVHGISAAVYVACHLLANEWVLGVSCRPWGLDANIFGSLFAVFASGCTLCQILRVEDNRRARRACEFLQSLNVLGSERLRFQTFLLFLEYAFMLTENMLFLFFLIGMTGGS